MILGKGFDINVRTSRGTALHTQHLPSMYINYVNLENKAVEKCFLDVVVEDLVSDVHIKAYITS